MSHDVKSRGAENSLGPPPGAGQWASRERGSGTPGAGSGQGPEGQGKPLPHVRHQTHPTLAQMPGSYLELWARGGGLGFLAKALPELGRGKRAGPRVNIIGPLPVPVTGQREDQVHWNLSPPPSPRQIAQGVPRASAQLAGRTCSTQGGGKASFSLPGWLGIQDSPHPLSAAWPQRGHEVWVQKQDTTREPWPSPSEEPRLQGGAAGPILGSGTWGQKPAPAPAHSPGEVLRFRLASRAGRLGPWVAMATGSGACASRATFFSVPPCSCPASLGEGLCQGEGPRHLSR